MGMGLIFHRVTRGDPDLFNGVNTLTGLADVVIGLAFPSASHRPETPRAGLSR
jgi:hypothetical protein